MFGVGRNSDDIVPADPLGGSSRPARGGRFRGVECAKQFQYFQIAS